MADIKEEYYFSYVPEFEQDNQYIDWKVYDLTLNVILTYSAVETRMASFLSKWDLFPSAFNLMVILSRTGGHGMHLSRISELLAVSRANVTGLVDVLARKNLVNRTQSISDRRVRLAVLTPEGKKLIDDILPQYYQFHAGLGSGINESEFATLVKVLTQLRQSIKADQPAEEESIRSGR